jgi:hypothetical protein
MILMTVKWTGPIPGVTLKARELNAIKRAGYEKIGLLWHRTMRPKHFTQAGAKEYGYTPRSGEDAARGSKSFRQSYTGRKWRTKGHTFPLMWSGMSRQLSRIRDVRATSKGVRIVIRAPALNFRNPHTKINMREEMTRVSIKERDQLIRELDRQMDLEMNLALRGFSLTTTAVA